MPDDDLAMTSPLLSEANFGTSPIAEEAPASARQPSRGAAVGDRGARAAAGDRGAGSAVQSESDSGSSHSSRVGSSLRARSVARLRRAGRAKRTRSPNPSAVGDASPGGQVPELGQALRRAFYRKLPIARTQWVSCGTTGEAWVRYRSPDRKKQKQQPRKKRREFDRSAVGAGREKE